MMMRTNKFRRILALLLLAVMASSLLGVTAMAEPLAVDSTKKISLPKADWSEGVIEAKLLDTKDADAMEATAYNLINVNSVEAKTADGEKIYQPGDPEYYWADGICDWIKENYPQLIKDDNSVTPQYATMAEDEAAEFFGLLEAAIENGDISGLTEVEGGKSKISDKVTARFEGLTMGQHLVVIKEANSVYKSTVVSVAPFTAVNPETGEKEWYVNKETVISMKGTPVTVEKRIVNTAIVPKEVEKGQPPEMEEIITGYTDDISAGYGGKVSYRIVSLIPAYLDEMQSWDYEIKDEMTNLTLIADSIKIVLDDKEDITAKVIEKNLLTTGSNQFKIEFSDEETYKEFLDGHEKVTVTYDATLDSSAVLVEGNPNNVTLTYSNNPYVSDQSTTREDENRVYTYGVEMLKLKRVRKEESTLEGAEFVLMNAAGEELHVRKQADGTYKVDPDGEDVLTTDAEGKLTIIGLGEGDYSMKETLVPDKTLNPKPPIVKFTIKGEVDPITGHRTGRVDAGLGDKPEALQEPQPPVPDASGKVPAAAQRAYEKALAEYNAREAERAEWDRKHAIEDKGLYPLKVINLPRAGARTGGLGTIPFTMLGVVLMALGGAIIVTTCRRRGEQV